MLNELHGAVLHSLFSVVAMKLQKRFVDYKTSPTFSFSLLFNCFWSLKDPSKRIPVKLNKMPSAGFSAQKYSSTVCLWTNGDNKEGDNLWSGFTLIFLSVLIVWRVNTVRSRFHTAVSALHAGRASFSGSQSLLSDTGKVIILTPWSVSSLNLDL